MRLLPFLLAPAALVAEAPAPAPADLPLSKAEKAQALDLLAKSQGDLAKALEGLSEAQLHFKAPEMLQPKGQYKDAKAVLAAYTPAHAPLVAAIEKGEGLRNRVAPQPAFGVLDLYQWVLLAAEHTQRHLLQIAEVKAEKGYPAK